MKKAKWIYEDATVVVRSMTTKMVIYQLAKKGKNVPSQYKGLEKKLFYTPRESWDKCAVEIV